MKQLTFIVLFGLLGVVARYGLGQWALKAFPAASVWVTFGINGIGAFLIGIVHVLGLERNVLSPELRLGLSVGLLGGFTTFSAYCLDALRLWENDEFMQTAFYYLGSPLLGLLACYAGVQLMRAVLGSS